MAVSSSRIYSAEKASLPNYDLGFKLLIALLAFEYMRPHHFFPALNILRIGMILQLCIFFYLITRFPFSLTKMAYGILGFFLLMAFNIPFAYNNYIAFHSTKYMAKLASTYFLPIMVFVNRRETLKKFISWYILLTVAVGVFGLTKGGRGIGHFLVDENDLCLALNIVLPFAYFRFLGSEDKKTRAFYAMCSLVILAAIVSTMSRGGFVGVAAVLLYCVWRTPGKKKVIKIVIVLSVIAYMSVPASYWREMKTLEQGTEDGTIESRIYHWKIGWRIFLDHPILGVGVGNYRMINHVYQGPEAGVTERHLWGRSSHSMYIDLLSEFGIAGIILFLYLLRLFYVNNKSLLKFYSTNQKELPQQKKRNKKYHHLGTSEFYYYTSLSLNGGMIGLLVSGAFLSVLYYPHYWILLSLSSALKGIFDREVITEECLSPNDLMVDKSTAAP